MAVDGLDFAAEVFYRRLMSICDDYGCWYASAALLLAYLYPLRVDSLTTADVKKWLAECVNHGLIVVYEADGKQLLQIVRFDQTIRQKRQKFPMPEK